MSADFDVVPGSVCRDDHGRLLRYGVGVRPVRVGDVVDIGRKSCGKVIGNKDALIAIQPTAETYRVLRKSRDLTFVSAEQGL